jgi:hypothetical protein
MSNTELKKINVEKRFRMVLDFKIIIVEITEDRVQEYYRFHGNDQDKMERARVWESAKRQNRLLRALIKNQEALDKFLTHIIMEEIDFSDAELKKVFQVESEREMLNIVISKLAKKDALYFQELQDEDSFWENAEMFGESFVIELVGVSLAETRIIKQGLIE